MSEAELVALQHTLYESRNATRRWLHNSRQQWITRAIGKYCPVGERALEVGPGSGIYIPTLKSVCREVYVSDCEKAYLSAIERHYSGDRALKPTVDDITRSTLPSNFFDLVLCTEVLEHLLDSPAALGHITRIMKPRGILVLSTPQRYSSLELTARVALSPGFIKLTKLIYREPVLEMGHINLMTAASLRRQLAASKLRVLEQHKGGLYLPGVAELCGELAQRLARRLEAALLATPFDGVLWTQYYVATRDS